MFFIAQKELKNLLMAIVGSNSCILNGINAFDSHCCLKFTTPAIVFISKAIYTCILAVTTSVLL